jgi:hypothetical protein
MKLLIIPMDLDEANAFVEQHHRHHKRVVGHKFSIGVSKGDVVCGVAIVSRPVARYLDNGWTLEVTRCCTDGTPNAASLLYGAARRACFALGYKKLITYTLKEESGVSLRASGWKCLGEAGGGSWSVPSRPRVDKHPLQRKLRWETLPDNHLPSNNTTRSPKHTSHEDEHGKDSRMAAQGRTEPEGRIERLGESVV